MIALKPFLDANVVEYHTDDGTGGMHNQIEQYNDALKRLQKDEVKWFLFFDVDEFVTMSSGSCLETYLKKFDNKHMYWESWFNTRRSNI